MEKNKQTPFTELPEALVEEMLSKSEQVGMVLFNSFVEIQEKKRTNEETIARSRYLEKRY